MTTHLMVMKAYYHPVRLAPSLTQLVEVLGNILLVGLSLDGKALPSQEVSP